VRDHGDHARALIVTLALDDDSTARLDALRRTHFPPGRNVLAAHLTLFHHLPGDQVAEVRDALAEVARRPAFEVALPGVRSLGRGVAVRVESAPLLAVRAELAARFEPWLTPQDRQPFSAHVTVQNKGTPERARAVLDQLSAELAPSTATATGLQLFRYLGGPWEPVAVCAFAHERSCRGSTPKRPPYDAL